MRRVTATEFKAKCLAILDEVSSTGEEVTILKRGKPVARVVPPATGVRYPQASLKGSVKILGDVISPVFPEEDWDVLRETTR
jgi:prevent-host-death family protein